MSFDYIDFWNQNYSLGGTSGSGSYGLLAEFKSQIINDMIQKHAITTVIEFGCGDGNQLQTMNYAHYLGLDVAQSSINLCKELYKDDRNKSFMLYTPGYLINRGFFRADLVVCLDVLYHITDEQDFCSTLNDLFQSSNRWVVLYTKITTGLEPQEVPTILDRDIMSYLAKHGDYKITEIIQQRHPELSSSHFILLERVSSSLT
ncbi:methyltransferase domain-containing protein [Paenibacillus sp. 5J-6]|uniref:Methyltransferase domain-containing protein n=1 Tax=Paenibacillus silvestris TaxID=2606219 RepID=A0A6L8UVB6_9BACL|nr:class I SAM-dependent methyltransferase [Paenibacillus silvestris]MZQ81331.1 methyltransferase domain-containing protein [Paenibacillus silvestris]